MKSIVALLCLVVVVAANAADKYTMKDLQALAKADSWDELVAHALDIAPSERSSEWQGLVEKASITRINALKPTELTYLDSTRSMIDADEKAFPFLKKSADYKLAAGKAMIKTYRSCYNSRSCRNGSDIDWIVDVRHYIEKETANDPTLACDAGDMIGASMVGTTTLWFYETATAKKKDCCQSDTLKKAVAYSLKDAEYKADAQKIASRCK